MLLSETQMHPPVLLLLFLSWLCSDVRDWNSVKLHTVLPSSVDRMNSMSALFKLSMFIRVSEDFSLSAVGYYAYYGKHLFCVHVTPKVKLHVEIRLAFMCKL